MMKENGYFDTDLNMDGSVDPLDYSILEAIVKSMIESKLLDFQ